MSAAIAETIPFTPAHAISPPPPVSPSPCLPVLNPGLPVLNPGLPVLNPVLPVLNPEPRTLNPPWSPTDRDRLIFQWVKFDGHKQSWVATQLGIHQTTVSRIVDRYERWIAHGGPSQEGGLSRDERLRAQRYLTYERNEWILNSALRIAGEMEIPIDVSTSNIKKKPQDYTKELEVRTQHAVLHRSGLACRFLRLAHRINMDQQKLVERDPLPDLELLSHHDLAPDDDHLPAIADTEGSPLGPRVDSARTDFPEPGTVPISRDDSPVVADSPDEVVAGSPDPASVVAGSPDPATSPTEGLPAGCHGHSARANRTHDGSSTEDCSNAPREFAETLDRPAPIAEPPTGSPTTHKTHTSMQPELDITDCSIDLYSQNHSAQQTPTPAYAVAQFPPETAAPAKPPSPSTCVSDYSPAYG